MSAYISRETLAEWRAACDGESDFHEARILRLIDALEAPCGSCHPCNDWAAETWRQSGGPLPHKHIVDGWREKAALAEVADYLLRKVIDYWDGRPLTHHGDHIYADLLDVLKAITPSEQTCVLPPEGGDA